MLGTAAACLLAMAPAGAQAGATVIVVNVDPPGVGFNDTTPVSPVGGNPGTTLGEQRQIAFQLAADIWGSIVDSDVPIRVQGSFAPLSCSSGSAVLGQAGPIAIRANFFSAPIFDTWYPVALSNAIEGVDQSGGDDIQASFNGDIDGNNNCLNGVNWYYGLDNDPPGNDVDFFNTLMHELAHGLGFAGFANLETGSWAGMPFYPDIFGRFTYDTDLELAWDEMSSGQRATSATNDGDLVWTGPAVTQLAPQILGAGLGEGGFVRLYAPTSLRVGSSVYHWDTAVSPNALMEPFLTGSLAAGEDVDLTAAQLKDIGWVLVDSDGDLIPNVNDNCVLADNVDQANTDGDLFGDACDNCTLVPNGDQFDTDFDGYGNICDADLNNDGVVNFGDLALFKAAFLGTDPDADFNVDGSVNFGDLAILKASFLSPPGPSGVAP